MLMFLVPIFVEDLPEARRPAADADAVRRDRVEHPARNYWFIIFPLDSAAIWGFKKWKATESGRQMWDTFKLQLPMRIGDTVLKVDDGALLAHAVDLVAAGVDIIKALEITGQTSGNWVIEEALADVRAKVHEGIPIAQPLVENPIFPPMVAPDGADRRGDRRAREDAREDRRLLRGRGRRCRQSLTSIIEPIMMIGVGCMVGVIIIAMYMPMFKMLTLVK